MSGIFKNRGLGCLSGDTFTINGLDPESPVSEMLQEVGGGAVGLSTGLAKSIGSSQLSSGVTDGWNQMSSGLLQAPEVVHSIFAEPSTQLMDEGVKLETPEPRNLGFSTLLTQPVQEVGQVVSEIATPFIQPTIKSSTQQVIEEERKKWILWIAGGLLVAGLGYYLIRDKGE